MVRWRSIAIGAAVASIIAACSSDSDAPAPDANRPPVFTSSATASVAENASGSVYAATASDADGDALTFSIAGGADAAAFSITPAGSLSFVTPPDFENPADAGGDNTYDVNIAASDGTATATLALTIAVTNASEALSVRRAAVGLSLPLYAVGTGDGTGRLFIVEQRGQIEILDPATGILNPIPFLDVSSALSTGDEQGLLGMALAPDFASTGVFYIHLTNVAGDTEIRRYTTLAGNPDQADATSGDVIFTANQPATNHNGGWIDFGPDGFLYIALGDGGGANDPFNQAQDMDTPLGAILRIDPSSDDFPADPDRDYGIPAGNPFPTAGAPEIFHYGLRNPFRCSFDRQTGDLYIGDVGQGAIEEIDLAPAGVSGLNFGWPVLEGTRVNQTGSTAGFTPPIAQYGHGSGEREGRSVTGGYVYRGSVADLQNRYVFSDFVTANLWSIPTADIAQGATIAAADFQIETDNFAPDIGGFDNVSSFGEDDAGELYILDFDGEVFAVESL